METEVCCPSRGEIETEIRFSSADGYDAQKLLLQLKHLAKQRGLEKDGVRRLEVRDRCKVLTKWCKRLTASWAGDCD